MGAFSNQQITMTESASGKDLDVMRHVEMQDMDVSQ